MAILFWLWPKAALRNLWIDCFLLFRLHLMIRVLHVINSFGRGGSETQLLQILKEYDRTQFHIEASTIGSEPGLLAHAARELGSEILSCPKSPNLFSFSRRVAREIHEKQYHIVHAHFDAWSGPILRGAAQAGVPVRIAHLRSSGAQGMGVANTRLARIGRNIVVRLGRHWIERYATHVLGVSGAALDARWPGWQSNPQRFMVWTAGVDCRYFSPGNTHSSIHKIPHPNPLPKGEGASGFGGVPDVRPITNQSAGFDTVSSPNIVCVGNFFLRSKRQDLALRIFSLVRKSVPSARLVFVGHGTYEKDCRELAEELGVAGFVDFVGLRDRREVLNLLRAATVFLSCSESEGLPNVLLEAQAVGVPVVASDIPANREALAPDFHDYLFRHDRLESACAYVLRFLTDPELRTRLGRIGRRHVQTHYDSTRCLARLETLYKTLVQDFMNTVASTTTVPTK
ncbi:MAG: glycosyltransferase [Desulfomonilaceae bacterium]|nr:glycosyltransferase [Desulfomonilaceae bacterium]